MSNLATTGRGRKRPATDFATCQPVLLAEDITSEAAKAFDGCTDEIDLSDAEQAALFFQSRDTTLKAVRGFSERIEAIEVSGDMGDSARAAANAKATDLAAKARARIKSDLLRWMDNQLTVLRDRSRDEFPNWPHVLAANTRRLHAPHWAHAFAADMQRLAEEPDDDEVEEPDMSSRLKPAAVPDETVSEEPSVEEKPAKKKHEFDNFDRPDDTTPITFSIPPHDFWSNEAQEKIREGMVPELFWNVGNEYATRHGFDRDALIMTMLTMYSSVISTKIKVAENQSIDSMFQQSIRIWTANVGVAGSGKSPILEAVEPPFVEIDKKFADEFKAELADFKQRSPEEQKTMDRPIKIRHILPDYSTESAQKVFADNEAAGHDSAVLGKFDELITFFGSKARYSGKGNGGEQTSRGFWLSTYDSKRFTLTRMSREEIDCTPSISIIGGLQPAVLMSLMEEASQNDGLVQRFCAVMMPDSPPPKVDLKDVEYPMTQFWDLVKDTFYNCPLRMSGAVLHFDPKAVPVKDQFFKWVEEQVNYYRPIDTALASHVNKFKGMFLRFAGLFHVAAHYRDKQARMISRDTAWMTYRFMTGPRLSNAVAFYNSISANPENTDLKAVAEFILRNRLQIVSAREIQQGTNRYRNISTRDIANTVGNMVSLGWLHFIVRKRTDQYNWSVNPDVHRVFAHRTAIIREKHAERVAVHEKIISEGGRRKHDATSGG
jgi:hypothetical protein